MSSSRSGRLGVISVRYVGQEMGYHIAHDLPAYHILHIMGHNVGGVGGG